MNDCIRKYRQITEVLFLAGGSDHVTGVSTETDVVVNEGSTLKTVRVGVEGK